MASFTKSNQTDYLIMPVDVPAASGVIGPTLLVPTQLEATIYFRIYRRTSTAFTNGWPKIIIEGNPTDGASDGARWYSMYEYTALIGSSIASTTNSLATIAGTGVIPVASASNIAAGDRLFIGNNAPSGYEFGIVRLVNGTYIHLLEPLNYNHTTGNVVSDQAEEFALQLSLASVRAIRAVVDNTGNATQTIAVEVLMSTADTIG